MKKPIVRLLHFNALLLVGLLVLLMIGCAAHDPPVDKRSNQKAGFWMIAALIGAQIYRTETAKSQAKKAESAAKKRQAKQIEAELELAGQQRTLTEKQMQLQVGQRQIDILANLFDEQDRTEPVIYTLPSAEPTSPIERINRAIDDFFRK